MKKNIKNKIKDNKKSLIWIFLALISVIFISYSYYDSNKEFHVHADFKVIINDNIINFSQDKYQSTQFRVLDENVHLHDSNGDVIHYHAKNQNLSHFLSSLDIDLNQNCIEFENISYCNNETHNLVFYLNQELVQDLSSYVVEDLDQILIFYGDKNLNSRKYFDLVSDRACIESAKCPERGEPSEGTCVTGTTCAVDLSFLED